MEYYQNLFIKGEEWEGNSAKERGFCENEIE